MSAAANGLRSAGVRQGAETAGLIYVDAAEPGYMRRRQVRASHHLRQRPSRFARAGCERHGDARTDAAEAAVLNFLEAGSSADSGARAAVRHR